MLGTRTLIPAVLLLSLFIAPALSSKPSQIVIGGEINKFENCTSQLFYDLIKLNTKGDNYPIEHHNVETEDGYIITIFRIQASGTKM